MPIEPGQPLPDVPVIVMRDGAPAEVSSRELLGTGTVVLFAVPGAFTPGCTRKHLPGYVEHAADLAGKGVDQVACISVNDVYVMDAWGSAYDVTGSITMIADPDASFAQAVDLAIDVPRNRLGLRSQRYAMVLRDGIVTDLLLEDNGLSVEHSTAACVLDVL
ncbi:MAG: redoxin family protein [Actinomycetales bacterium]|nr:redoxin family protein [Actinomycetales bacterium]